MKVFNIIIVLLLDVRISIRCRSVGHPLRCAMSRARCIPRRRKAAGGAWRGRRHGEVRRGGVRRAACGDHHALQRHPPPPLRRLQCGRAWCGARARLSPRQRSGGAGPMVRGGTARAKASASATRTRGCAVTCCRRGAHVPRRAARGRLRHSAAAAGGERTAPAPTCDASASMRLPLLPLLVLPLVLRPAAGQYTTPYIYLLTFTIN